ncbi:hypothetical protein PK98_01655 [Croceibacterium mercuriale]|uniref:PilZ domain-containing protein n=1 Tax=Croceibacterium mercuriale TaxID=1572751 RepID=A0A0B2BZH7_9SPHN|nr:hypothetical protein [Croceibacterium mercuriale]KHL25437.1 hypothetical protein PK98_01655 [Croceibacterium mercuriale]
MASLPELQPESDADRRAVPRTGLWLGVTLFAADGGAAIPAAIQNLSVTGFLAQLADGADAPAELEVALRDGRRRRAQIVWRGGATVGCNFTEPLTRADLSAARLRSEIRQLEEERGLPLLPNAPAPAMRPVASDDHDWLVEAETRAPEKWPLRRRLLFIAAAAVLPWAAIGGAVLALI